MHQKLFNKCYYRYYETAITVELIKEKHLRVSEVAQGKHRLGKGLDRSLGNTDALKCSRKEKKKLRELN